MTRCNKMRAPAALLLTLSLALLASGCSSLSRKNGTEANAGAAQTSAPPSTKGDPQQRFDQAAALMKKHQIKPAIAAFQALNKDFPQYSGPLTNLGLLYLQGKQWDQALQAFGQATTLNPKNATAWVGMGVARRNAGNYPGAEQAYRQALVAQPGNADAHYDLAILYDVYLRRPVDALKEYRAYRDAGHDDLIVAAWIKALEQQTGAKTAPASPASAAASAAPARAGAATVEKHQ